MGEFCFSGKKQNYYPNYFVIMERLGKKWKQWLTLHCSKKTGAKHKKVQIAVSERKETPLYWACH